MSFHTPAPSGIYLPLNFPAVQPARRRSSKGSEMYKTSQKMKDYDHVSARIWFIAKISDNENLFKYHFTRLWRLVYISGLGFQTLLGPFWRLFLVSPHNLPHFSHMSPGLIAGPGAPQ